jgi:predicted DNA-binding transcriptional regulator YafY
VITAVVIDYTNHRGERSLRRVEPDRHYFGSAEWHPEPQWLLDALDLDLDEYRTFAVKDIHSWRPATEEESELREGA